MKSINVSQKAAAYRIALIIAVTCTKICSAEVSSEPLSSETFAQQMAEQQNSRYVSQNNGLQDHNSIPTAHTGVPSLLSLSLKNATLQETVAALARMSGRNIIADPGVTEPVTLHLEKVSLPASLDILTAAQGLTYVEKDGVILITREDVLKKQATGFYTFTLNYAKAADIQKSLAAVLYSGKLAADPGSNSLLFNGSQAEARKIRESLLTLDAATQQVTLEAKILAIEKSEEKNLGLQWTWDTLPQYVTNQKNRDPGSDAKTKADNSSHQGRLRLWNHSQAYFCYTATLNALITSGKAKVLATPSLITVPGKEASIFIGSHIPVVTEKHNNGESTYSTEYVDAGIKLTYTPVVSRDGYITSSVHTEVSTPTLISELKNYRINSRTADTNVRMRNGETLIIGGLISEEEQKQLHQIPFLSKIPLLGALFKNHYSSKSKTEVIMLLTPHLSEAGKSPAIYGDQNTLLPVLKPTAVP